MKRNDDLDQAPSTTALTQDGAPADVFHLMFDHAGVGLFETALDGTIRSCNQALATLLGFASAEELIAEGRPALSFYVNPADMRRFRNRIGHSNVVRGMIVRLRRRDDREIWVSEHGSAIHGPDGAVLGYVGSLSDATELIETQARLAEAEADYRRIFERATEGIYRSSLDGQMLRANPALTRLNGYAAEEELLEAVTNIATEWYVDPDRRNDFKHLLELNGLVENFESEIYRHRSRERIWISENSYLVKDHDGNPLYYEGTVRDITEQKESELKMLRALKKAESADRSKSRFLAHMSHELRTPLNSILGFSEMLCNFEVFDLPPERIVEYADSIHRSGSHLLNLINDILDLSRIESDAAPLQPVAVPPADLIDEALETVRPIADAGGIELIAEIEPTAAALVDRRAIHQCLLNVLSNAVKFSPVGGIVRLFVKAGRRAVLFSVEDKGVGMPPEQLQQVGQPFYTIEDPARRRPPGTGLGLAITRSLLERMSGSLEIDSEPGVGTKVTLQVPEASGSAGG